MTKQHSGAARSLAFIGMLLGVAGTAFGSQRSPKTREASLGTYCAPTTTKKAIILSAYVNKIAVGGDTASRRILKFSHVSSVTWVTDEAKCQRVTKSLDTTFWSAPRGGPVYLMQVGSDFAAFPADLKSQASSLIVHLDAQYKVIASGGWM